MKECSEAQTRLGYSMTRTVLPWKDATTPPSPRSFSMQTLLLHSNAFSAVRWALVTSSKPSGFGVFKHPHLQHGLARSIIPLQNA